MGLSFGALAGLAGIDFGTSLLTGYVNDYYNRKAASKQYGYTKSLIDYQNEYNTPVEQRKRLEEAGYNPNLFYSTGANTSAGGSVSVDGGRVGNGTNLIGALQAYNLDAQNKLLKNQSELTEETANKTSAQARVEELKAEKLEKDLKFYNDTGFDPNTTLGSFVKPVYTAGKRVGNSSLGTIGGSMSDYEWNAMMDRARIRYNSRHGIKTRNLW